MTITDRISPTISTIPPTGIDILAPCLAQALKNHPVSALSYLAAWLDPVHFYPEDYLEDLDYWGVESENDAAALDYALCIARRCHPAIYTAVVSFIRAGHTLHEIEAFLIARFNEQYPCIDFDSIVEFPCGIPLVFYGIDPEALLDNREYKLWTSFLSRFFDVCPSPDHTRITYEAVDEAWTVAHHVANSLLRQDAQPFADLFLLVLYLFSRTGNTLLDMDAETYWDSGFEYLDFTTDNLENVNEAYRQCEVVLTAADRAVKRLADDPALAAALHSNIHLIRQAPPERRKDVCLTWPRPGKPEGCSPGEASPDDQVLLIRDCYLEEAG